MRPQAVSVSLGAAQAALIARPAPRAIARCVLFLSLILACAACSSPPLPKLPKLNIDQERIAVAGMSSGAYMATQVHLAYSDHLIGAALVAGGPYGCAEADVDTALGTCITAKPAAPDASKLAAIATQRSLEEKLAPLAGLARDRVVVLHGSQDGTVAEAVSRTSAQLYDTLAQDPSAAGLRVRWDAAWAFGHTFPTQASGFACSQSAPPYLGNCAFDAAGMLMRELFNAEKASAPAQTTGELREFDQQSYLPDGADAMLADRGYVYIPKSCFSKACGLLIAFHGCQQNAEKVGTAFVRDAGFNHWADALEVVVFYPQTRASYLPLNPKACWDWWGYTGKDYDTRSGVQIRWLANASAALGAPLR